MANDFSVQLDRNSLYFALILIVFFLASKNKTKRFSAKYRALVSFLKHMNWSTVSIVNTGRTENDEALNVLKNTLSDAQVCLFFI